MTPARIDFGEPMTESQITEERMRKIAALWMTAQPLVSGFVASLIRDRNAQDDVLQEIIAAVLEGSDAYDESRPFINWVLGIARNQVRLFRRRTLRGRVLFDDTVLDLLVNSFAAVRSEEVRKLEYLPECLERLSDREQQICELRYQRGLKPAGIASEMNLTPNTVSKTLQRIRDQLRTCIERKMKLSPPGGAI